MIGRAICSVLSQTFDDFELIVFSDGSTDNTADVVNSFNDPRIVFVMQPANQGCQHARNEGLRRSRGKYIALLDDDDEWLPNKLERQVAAFAAAPAEVGLIYCWAEWRDKQGKKFHEKKPTLRGNAAAAMMMAKQALGPPSSVMIRREVVGRVGYLDTDHHFGEERNYFMRICKSFEVDFVPEVVVRIHRGHEQMTDGTRKSLQHLTYAIERRLQHFRDDFNRFPEAYADVLGNLLATYLKTWQWVNVVRTELRILKCRAALWTKVRVTAKAGRSWMSHLKRRLGKRQSRQLTVANP
jgi:glycosyltransferase involved in cell wall biosynthesis